MPPSRRSQPQRGSSDAEPGPTVVKLSKTGRPLRSSSGKSTLPSGYVDSTSAVKASDSSSDDSDEDGTRHRRWKKKKKQALPEEPESLPIEPDDDDKFETIDEEMSSVTNSDQPNQEISLTFNAPPGPFVVKLDLGSLLSIPTSSLGTSFNSMIRLKSSAGLTSSIEARAQDPHMSTETLKNSGSMSNCSNDGKTGFLDLPPELRNAIYRLRLVSTQKIKNEASQILYGENSFQLKRDTHVRAKYYERQWLEVGWKDVRTFLQNIGPANISNLRDVAIYLTDGVSQDPTGDYNESHRCVNDEHLIACLLKLGSHSQLRCFTVELRVRKQISYNDSRFLNCLQRIKADEVKFEGEHSWSRWHYPYYNLSPPGGNQSNRPLAKMPAHLQKNCMKKMQRSPKLYWVAKKEKLTAADDKKKANAGNDDDPDNDSNGGWY